MSEMQVYSHDVEPDPYAGYASSRALLSEDELWEAMSLGEKLEFILTLLPAERWGETQYLHILTVLFDDPVLRLRIKARYRALKGNDYDLQQAVKGVLALVVADRASTNGIATGSTPPAPPVRFNTISAPELFAKVLPSQQWVIPGILPTGATLFTGRSKDGKSLLAWNLCFAVATGGVALSHYQVECGEVLYLALEDGVRRAKERLIDQMAHMGPHAVAPLTLDIVPWEAPRIGEGFEERLTTWLDEHTQARLIVVDILEKVRPHRARNGSVYADDYAAITPMNAIAQARNVALLIIHHSNKTNPEDWRDTASGSTGLTGACDTFWSLSRMAGAPDAVLRIIGRDVEAQELAMEFKDGFWSVLGDAAAFRISKESTAILDALKTLGKPSTPSELAKLLQVKAATMRVRLVRMADRGEVVNTGSGLYIQGTPSPPLTPTLYSHTQGGDIVEEEEIVV